MEKKTTPESVLRIATDKGINTDRIFRCEDHWDFMSTIWDAVPEVDKTRGRIYGEGEEFLAVYDLGESILYCEVPREKVDHSRAALESDCVENIANLSGSDYVIMNTSW